MRISAEREKIFSVGDMGRGEFLASFSKTFPLQLGELILDELLHLLITAYSLANPLFPYLGDTNLASFPAVILN